MCNDGKSLIVSDGSNKLTFLNPESLSIEKTLTVYAGDQEVAYLNELEYVDGHIYANVYTTNQIAKIDATNGKVLAVSDLKDIVNENTDGEVLNGIAYSPVTKTFLSQENTGKICMKLGLINTYASSFHFFQVLIKPLVELSKDFVSLFSCNSGMILPANCLPSSTPHWSKL